MRAQEFITEAKAIDAGIIKRAMDANMSKLLGSAAKSAVPFIGPLLGFYFAAERYKDRPDDYVGMALEVATGFASGLGAGLLGVAVIVTRDIYYDVIKLTKQQPLVEPEYLQLTGYMSDDLIKNPTIVNQLRKQIQEAVEKRLKETVAQAKEIEAQSKIDRNLAPAEYNSGPLKGWTHPQTTKAFNQRSATGREYK